MNKGIKVKILTDHNYFDIHSADEVLWTKLIASDLETEGIEYFIYKISGEGAGAGYYSGSIFRPNGKCIYQDFRLEKKVVDYFADRMRIKTILEVE